MTANDARQAFTGVLDGVIGKGLRSLVLALLVPLVLYAGKQVNETLNDHGKSLTTLQADFKNLVSTIDGHNAYVDAQLTALAKAAAETHDAVTRMEQAAKDSGEVAPRRMRGQ